LVPNANVVTYYGEDGYDKVLAYKEIEGVILAVPIDSLPDMVLKALQAGKHVISEKPISPTVKRGQELVDAYEQNYKSKLVWGVAENYYYEPSFIQAAQWIANGKIGTPRVVNATMLTNMGPDSQYYHTQWRQSPTYQGGYLLDAGVHTVAAMRMMMGDVSTVLGITAQFKDDLPPCDTLACSFRFKSGALGVFTMSFACSKLASPFAGYSPYLFTIVGDAGILHVGRDTLEIITSDAVGTHVSKPMFQRDVNTSLVAEFDAFVEAVSTGSRAKLYSPQQALQDVAFLEAVLSCKQ